MTYNEFRWQWVFGVAIILALLQVPSSDGVDRGQERNMQAIKFLTELLQSQFNAKYALISR